MYEKCHVCTYVVKIKKINLKNVLIKYDFYPVCQNETLSGLNNRMTCRRHFIRVNS